ncbi:MAG: hypothetical protein RL376_562 [Verrucomicrobiota bacterium]|jgi:putative hydrolase of the HAD superfamily
MIRGILIDPEGVLFLPENGAVAFFNGQASRWADAAARGKGTEQELGLRLWFLYRTRPGDPGRMYSEIVSEFGLPEASRRFMLQEFERSFPRGPQLQPDARLTLGRLQRRGYRLGLVAEGTVREHAARLEGARLTEFWETTLITEAHGGGGLDRKLFGCALNCLGLGAEETVFVSAGTAAGFTPAQQAGLATFWVGEARNPLPPKTSFHLGRFGELPSALDVFEGLRAAS